MVLLDPECRPTRGTPGSAGWDLRARMLRPVTLHTQTHLRVPVGIRLELPPGTVGMICSRSGLAARHQVVVANAPGSIDPDYQGEIEVILANYGVRPLILEPYERIAQLLIVPVLTPTWALTDGFSDHTERGTLGFGSTGTH